MTYLTDSFRHETVETPARWARPTNDATRPGQTLADQLRLQNVGLSLAMPDRDRANIEQRISEARKMGVANLALNTGDRAPRLDASLFNRGPVVLSFYMGDWSPYCTLAFRAMQDWTPEFERFDARFVAIGSETSYGFPVRDIGNHLAKRFGLLFPLTDDVVRAYRSLGFDAPRSHNASRSLFVPLPATYVIDHRRVIRYAFVNPDYRRRTEPADVVAALARL